MIREIALPLKIISAISFFFPAISGAVANDNIAARGGSSRALRAPLEHIRLVEPRSSSDLPSRVGKDNIAPEEVVHRSLFSFDFFSIIRDIFGMPGTTCTNESWASDVSFDFCVGNSSDECITQIKTTYPSETGCIEFIVIDQNAFVTMDYRMDRMRIRVDDDQIVVQEPRVG
mmetsp:Transcript_41303/g.96845  ORF Transcript_41303/g.96845 Transcript_41303/m.96845 type:complete len:173 (-) Transcript_41303:276-794(-)|eukprot:CAMPEP_0113315858 /NCGR_PEP_ID=MMETSP0010_2-20120614/11357_1 /TAXON_ID=216773 ORGANISM="Corethron hystrix, Strain 308" /NCGR_SAMPLE_ID=MMETSP0010_2 /ASSEMBLY_ACC=CAM_ASM_000155 /LENGTH=172 /DNA_ID=CAMNT_0000172441 /DNA_START=51 /DNA_END=569 /DNA_ORIENTATION=+ /assembly_acc=CAM_ASM_000155